MKSKLVLLLPIRCILFIVIFLSIMGITHKELTELTDCWSIVCSIVNILLIILLVILTKLNNSNYFELMNYEKDKTNFKDILIVCLIVLFLGTGGMYLSGLIFYQKFPYMCPEMASTLPIWLAIINAFILPISTALAEDGLYLGCGVNGIENKYLKVIIPGFFFAIQHSFIPFLFDMRFILYRFFSFLPLTMILCYIYSKKKNPLPILIAHTLIDIATVIIIIIVSINPNIFNV